MNVRTGIVFKSGQGLGNSPPPPLKKTAKKKKTAEKQNHPRAALGKNIEQVLSYSN